MYKFEVHQVGKNKRITLFHTGGKCSEFCSVYVARPDEFAEIPKNQKRNGQAPSPQG